MRLAIHDYGGYPFSAQLARELARRGHEVTYLHAAGFRSPKAAVAASRDDPSSVRLRGIDIGEPFRRDASIGRWRQERRYGELVSAAVREVRAEVVVSANCPLDAQGRILEATHAIGGAFVFWVQDLYSLAVGRLLGRRLPLLGRLVGARYGRLERSLLRSSEGTIAISDDFLPTLHGWGLPSDRIDVVENWAPLEAGAPVDRDNRWAADHGLTGVPTLLYAGTLGRKHDPALLVRLADALPGARIVVVADGVGADWLQREGQRRSNLTLLPLQPAERLPEVLASADVLLAMLEPDAGAFSVPSKVLSYLAAGRPTLAAIPAGNAAARLLRETGGGVVVEPDDSEGFVSTAAALADDEPRRAAIGQAARAAAEARFEIGPVADRFEAILGRARERSARGLAGPSDTAGASTDKQTEANR